MRSQFIKILITLGPVAAVLFVALVVWSVGEERADKVATEQYNAAARAGVPIVEAIYQYRNDTELFPEKLEDLERVSPLRADTGVWNYQWDRGFPRLENRGNDAPYGLTYLIASPNFGWFVANRGYGDVASHINAPVAIPAPPERSQAEKQRLVVQEIEMRIARNGSEAIHHEWLISCYMKAGDLAGAVAAATRMHERRLAPWWELQILARLLHQLGEDNWAEWEMRELAEQKQEFLPFFDLAWFYRETGQPDAALEMIRTGSPLPFGKGDTHDRYVDDYYFWMATVYAYQKRRPDLVLTLCDSWDRNDQQRGYGSPDPGALRAVALLAQGRTAEAQASIEKAIKFQQGQGGQVCWAGKLEKIARAIQRGDAKYRWKPESYPEMDGYELLVTYQ